MNNQRLKQLICVYIGVIFTGFSSIIAADPASQLQAIKEAAESYVETLISSPTHGKLTVKAGHLDSRLRFTNCPSALLTTIPGRQSLNKSVTVLVRCEEDEWQIYIPVEIRLMTPIVVAKRSLGRGVTVNESDVMIQLVDARFQRGRTYTDTATLIGARIKRVVGIGEPIQGNDICMVCRNDEVLISATKNGLQIIAKGSALSDGALGEQIKVRNNKSNRIVNATISAVGRVDIKF